MNGAVSCAWLQARIGDPRVRVVDVSVIATPPASQGEPWGAAPDLEGYAAGHIPGAVFADLVNELSDRGAPFPYTVPSAEQVDAFCERAGIDQGTRVVFYDGRGGAFACRGWLVLRHYGHEAVSVLDGGLPAWTAAGLPLSRETPTYPGGTFVARPRGGVLVGTRDVLRVLGDGSAQLVNALTRGQWDGTDVSAYTRVGQIPGSVEVAGSSLVDPATGLFLEDAAAAAVVAAAGVDLSRSIVAYCGGGVSAAKTALVLLGLGAPSVSVYDGSLSEWTANPSLPLEGGA